MKKSERDKLRAQYHQAKTMGSETLIELLDSYERLVKALQNAKTALEQHNFDLESGYLIDIIPTLKDCGEA